MHPESQQYFYHSDHLGSSSFISDASGEACQFLAYLPFGEQWVDQRSSGSWDAPYKFSGKELDAETGYSYFGARYYDSGLSVWLSVDPMAEKRSWNTPYSFVSDNPINRIDPYGEIDRKARVEKKFDRKFDRWQARHRNDLKGLREDEIFNEFINSRNLVGRKRAYTRWFRNYQNYNDISNTTGWSVNISVPINDVIISRTHDGSGEGCLDETVQVPIKKGALQIDYNMYNIPDEIEIFDANNNRKIYGSRSKVRGIHSAQVRFRLSGESPQIRILINQGITTDEETIFKYDIILMDRNRDVSDPKINVLDTKPN